MRSAAFFLFASALLAAGCAPVIPATPLDPGPGPQPTAFQFPTTGPALTADPVAVGKQLLETSRLHWLVPPRPFVVEMMSLAEAQRRIPPLSDEQLQIHGAATAVWLVVFQGRWQLEPPDPTHANPTPITYDGCVFVLFTDAGNELIALGDTSCPGKP